MGGFLEVPVGAGERFAGEEWMVLDGRDVAGAHRTIARILQSGPVPFGDGMAGPLKSRGRCLLPVPLSRDDLWIWMAVARPVAVSRPAG